MDEDIIKAYSSFVAEFRRLSDANVSLNMRGQPLVLYDLQQHPDRYYRARNCFYIVRNHRCSKECNFLQLKSVMICRCSGNVHICSADACDSLVTTRESRVCTLTAFSYPLELEDDIYGSKKNSETAYVPPPTPVSLLTPTASPNPSPVPSPLPSPPVVNDRKRPRNTTFSACWSEEPHEEALKRKGPPPVPIINPAVKRRLPRAAKTQVDVKKECTQLIKQFFAFFKLEYTSELIMWIAEVSTSLWYVAVASECYAQRPFAYRLEYHVLVVMYNMCDGFRHGPNGPQVIPQIKTLQENLPVVKDIRAFRIKGTQVKARWFTNTGRTFRDILDTADATKLAAHCRMVQNDAPSALSLSHELSSPQGQRSQSTR